MFCSDYSIFCSKIDKGTPQTLCLSPPCANHKAQLFILVAWSVLEEKKVFSELWNYLRLFFFLWIYMVLMVQRVYFEFS